MPMRAEIASLAPMRNFISDGPLVFWLPFRYSTHRVNKDSIFGATSLALVVMRMATRRTRQRKKTRGCRVERHPRAPQGTDFAVAPLRSPYRREEFVDFKLEMIAFAGERLRRGENLRRRGAGFAGAAIDVSDVRRD